MQALSRRYYLYQYSQAGQYGQHINSLVFQRWLTMGTAIWQGLGYLCRTCPVLQLVPASAKCPQTLVSGLPLTSRSTSLLPLPIQRLQGVYQPYSHCYTCPAPTVSLQGKGWKATKKMKPATICRDAQCTSANMFVCKWYILQKTFPLIPGGSFTLMFAQRILSLKMHQINKKKWLKSNFTTAKVHKAKINITAFPFL